MNGVQTESSCGDELQIFGFLPQDSISKMQSPNYDMRIESSQNILEYIPTIPIEEINVPDFLDFIQDYVSDLNLKVAQNCSQIVGEIINATKGTENVPVSQCVAIAVNQLRDKRRFVIQLGIAVLGDLIRASSSESVLSELNKQTTTELDSLHIQIFRALTTLMTQRVLEPNLLLSYALNFDVALTSTNEDLKQAALWCVDFLKGSYPSTFESLLPLLSQQATRAVHRTNLVNPATAVPKYRMHGPSSLRPINTAGIIQTIRSPISLSHSGNYHRPALPSARARHLMSLSRPVTTTFADDSSVKSAPTFSEKYAAPENLDDDDDEVVFSELPNIDSKPIIGSLLDRDDSKPKVGRKHFEKAVFDDLPKAKNILPKLPKQPKSLLAKLHKEFDETPIQGNFGNSHFDESAFNDIEPLVKPKSKSNDHPSQLERVITKQRNSSSLGYDKPPSRLDLQHEQREPREQRGRISALGTADPEALEVVPTKPKKKTVKFSPHPQTSENKEDLDSRPIFNSSGEYDFNNDPFISLEGDHQVSMPTVKQDKAKKNPRKFTIKQKIQPAPPKVTKEKKAPKTPNPEQLLENLESDDWEVQNSAILALSNSYPADVVKASLRNAMTSLLECAKSTRTTLAKNALNLIQIWIDDQEVPVSPVSEVMATRLLKLLQQQASHHFIVDLAKKCFISLLDNITENKIATIVEREFKSPFAQARAMVADGIYQSMKNIEDPAPFLVPLAYLGKDADQNARKSAKLAVKEIAAKKDDFADYVKDFVSSSEDQETLVRLSKAP